jgi:hypothetical protein
MRRSPVPDAPSHLADTILNLAVVVIRIALKMERRTEVKSVAGGQRQRHAQEQLRQNRESWHTEQAGQPLQVSHGRILLFTADDRDRHHRRAGLERKAHEPQAELFELIATLERFGNAPCALWKHQQGVL